MYALLRPLLFSLDPETSHDLVIKLLAMISRWPPLLALLRTRDPGPALPISVMGIEFPNPVGLAAGLDKNARCYPALAALGFGFIELGTVTPQPQAGNPPPRLYRLIEDQALINRMGFNSVGLDRFITNLARLRRNCPIPLGINIGKNAATPLDRAIEDYAAALRRVYDHADYITINISSPNTAALRDLQTGAGLRDLLSGLQQVRSELQARSNKNVPLAVKLAPDLTPQQLDETAHTLLESNVDAVIATNTTTQRPAGLKSPHRTQEGGLSGLPLAPAATAATAHLFRALAGKIPIIGAGGIGGPAQALERLAAGADLLQVYTGFIYQGAALIRGLRRGIAQTMTDMQTDDLAAALRRLRSTNGSS